MKLLQEANKRNNDLLQRLERWEESYQELYKEHCRLETQLLCESCKQDKRQTLDGKTFILCDGCNCACLGHTDFALQQSQKD